MVGWDEAGHGIVMDAPSQYKGEGTGARPLEVFLQALGGLHRDGRRLRPREEAPALHRSGGRSSPRVQREDEFPKIYTRIELEYVVTGYGVKPAAVARAIELSEDKYCSVRGHARPAGHASLTSYRVEEASAPIPATTPRRSDHDAVHQYLSRDRLGPRGPPCLTPSCCPSTTRRPPSDAVLDAVRALLRRRGHRGRRRLDRRDAPGAGRARRHHRRAPRPELRLRVRAARSASASPTTWA